MTKLFTVLTATTALLATHLMFSESAPAATTSASVSGTYSFTEAGNTLSSAPVNGQCPTVAPSDSTLATRFDSGTINFDRNGNTTANAAGQITSTDVNGHLVIVPVLVNCTGQYKVSSGKSISYTQSCTSSDGSQKFVEQAIGVVTASNINLHVATDSNGNPLPILTYVNGVASVCGYSPEELNGFKE